jgi:predicted CoA-substrate-specific enzyme activase
MTKVVIIDKEGEICSYIAGPTGAEHRRMVNRVMDEALKQSTISFDEISYIVSTGYGRINVPFADRQITELTCHAKGIASMFPNAKTVIDIGGQDAKALKIGPNGKLLNFVMNDRCAAGTGRFLEVIADTLRVKLEELGPISLKAKNEVSITSLCTIFAEQEVVNCLSDGVSLEDLAGGLHAAVTGRVARMARKLKIEPDVVFTGGVAKNVGMVKALKDNLGFDIFVPDEPLLSGALGAALLARDVSLKAEADGEPLTRKERQLEEATFFD